LLLPLLLQLPGDLTWICSSLHAGARLIDAAACCHLLFVPLLLLLFGDLPHRLTDTAAAAAYCHMLIHILCCYSCLEIFTGSGEVLSTRIYRGSPPHGHADAGIEFVALDGDAHLDRVAAYEMASCFAAPHKRQWQPQQQQAAAAAAGAAQDLFDELAALHQQQRDEQSSLTSLFAADQQQQQLGQGAGLNLSLSLSSSLKAQQSLLLQQQHLASPRAADIAGKLQQLALAGVGLGEEQQLLQVEHVAVPEEELCADIFNFE
jgi:hypothetical protein